MGSLRPQLGDLRQASDFIEPGTGYRYTETGYREPQFDYQVQTSGNRRPAIVNRQSVIDDWDQHMYKHSTIHKDSHERRRPSVYDRSPDDLVSSESDPDTIVHPFTISSDRERVNSFVGMRSPEIWAVGRNHWIFPLNILARESELISLLLRNLMNSRVWTRKLKILMMTLRSLLQISYKGSQILLICL